MKKKILCALLTAAVICSCAGCGGNTPAATTMAAEAPAATAAGETKSDADASSIAKAVLDEIPIASAFEKKKDTLGDYFDDLNVDAIEDFNYTICASGAYPDEIAVFRFSSESDAEAAVPVMEARLEYQTKMYKDYTPDEVYKLEDAVIKQSGVWVWYLVTSNNTRADEIVRGQIR